MDNRKKLQRMAEIVTEAVCNVEAFVSKAQIDELRRLENLVGETWDAINGCWVALEAD